MGKVGQWLQVGANLGILAGLILVGFQLEQNSHLTRASLNSNHMDAWMAIDRSLQSENFADTLANAINEPERLTDAEVLEMQGYLRANLDQWLRDFRLYKFDVFKTSPELVVESDIKSVFGNRFAVAWWEVNRDWVVPPELRVIVDKVIANTQGIQDHDQQKLNQLRMKLRPPS